MIYKKEKNIDQQKKFDVLFCIEQQAEILVCDFHEVFRLSLYLIPVIYSVKKYISMEKYRGSEEKMKEAQNIVTKNHENHVEKKKTPKDLKKGSKIVNNK